MRPTRVSWSSLVVTDTFNCNQENEAPEYGSGVLESHREYVTESSRYVPKRPFDVVSWGPMSSTENCPINGFIVLVISYPTSL